MLVINLKTYKSGDLNLIKKINKVNKKIIIAAQPTDIYLFSKKFKNPIYAQHVDPFKPGRNTGYVLPEAVKEAGAKGVILNHSEHKLNLNVLKETINRCKRLNLKVLVCISNLNEAKKIKKLKPDIMAYEPKELISTRTSVSKAHPDVVRKFSDLLKSSKIIALCGAGIHNKQDVEIAKKLGCKGILVSSAVTKSKNPEKILKEFIK